MGRSILDLSKMRGVFSVLLGLLVSSVLSRVSYDSYSVLRVNVENEAQAELLLQLEEQGGFDFWSEVGLGRPLDVMTAPETKETLTQWLDDHSLQWSVMIEDVGVLIQGQLIPAANAPEPHAKHNMDWSSYHAMEDIYGWLDYLEATFDFVETEVIGQSHEGQDIGWSRCAREAVATSPPCGSTAESTPGSGSHLPSAPGCSTSSWRVILLTLISQKSSTGISSPTTILTVTGRLKTPIECGGRRQATTPEIPVMAPTPTAIGTTTGPKEVLLLTAVPKPTMDPAHSPRWRLRM